MILNTDKNQLKDKNKNVLVFFLLEIKLKMTLLKDSLHLIKK